MVQGQTSHCLQGAMAAEPRLQLLHIPCIASHISCQGSMFKPALTGSDCGNEICNSTLATNDLFMNKKWSGFKFPASCQTTFSWLAHKSKPALPGCHHDNAMRNAAR